MAVAQMSPREGNCTGAKNWLKPSRQGEVQGPQRLEEEGVDATWALFS